MILQLQAYAKWQEEWILIDHTLFNIFRLFLNATERSYTSHIKSKNVSLNNVYL